MHARQTSIPFACLAGLLAALALPAAAHAQGVAATPAPVAAPAADVMPFAHAERTLANGLKVIVVQTGFPDIVSIQVPVQTGSRNEVEPGKTGFAHFFEHMMFRGTPLFPPDKYQALLTRAGARSNAYTTNDYTNYYTTFAKDDLEAVLAAEADRFQHLSYDEATFKTESRAVLGEYNKNSSNPLRALDEAQHESAFTTHTYRHTTMGFIHDIEDMPNQFEYSHQFFDRWYRPEHATLVVAGDVEPEAVFALAGKYFSSWQRGSTVANVPQEPAATGPKYAHVKWDQPGLPWLAVAFHAPAFSDTQPDFAALDTLMDLTFGPTSALYKRLVEVEQVVDQLDPSLPATQDPALATVYARVKKPADVPYVRDEILKAFAAARERPVEARTLAEAQANARYGYVRTLDNTDRIAAQLARYVRFNRSYDTLNNYFRTLARLTPADLQAAARRFVTDANLVVTTLAKEPLPEAAGRQPALASLLPAATGGVGIATVVQPSPLPLVDMKLLFATGSADDPKGKEGLALLSASMIAEAGSRAQGYDEIKKALFPLGGSFGARVDREMTGFTGIVHRDTLQPFLDTVLPQLLDPGYREADFQRLKDAQRTALESDLKADNDEELGKERLQADVFAGTVYGHVPVGTLAGIESITLDDVRAFVRAHYTRSRLTIGLAGSLPTGAQERINAALAQLPAGGAAPATLAGLPPLGNKPAKGRQVEIITKDTRSTAISFGFPLGVTRASPDYAALALVKAWLGEHRASSGRLFQRIREVRGMNYGDYAYIEAFPRGMFQFFPDANLVRRDQLFEVWLRPLRSNEEGHMALRIALHELDALVKRGFTRGEFEATRNYLMKNVYLMTATQDQRLGYALDSRWYGTGEYVPTMRAALAKLTLTEANKALRRHLQTRDLQLVVITKDAEDMKRRLVSDLPSAMKYDGAKPAELLAEDKLVGATKLGIAPAAVTITPLARVFAE